MIFNQKNSKNVYFLLQNRYLKPKISCKSNGKWKLQTCFSRNYDFAFTNLLKNAAEWISTFLSLRHTNFENKFGGTPSYKKRPKWQKYSYLCILPFTFKDLTAHLEKLGDTLVGHRTPVEKHWVTILTETSNKYIWHKLH